MPAALMWLFIREFFGLFDLGSYFAACLFWMCFENVRILGWVSFFYSFLPPPQMLAKL